MDRSFVVQRAEALEDGLDALDTGFLEALEAARPQD